MRWILAFFAALLLSACADTGLPITPTPTTRPEPTALPPLDAWTQAAAPITLDNVQQITQLGRLDAPEPPSTLFAHALSLDNAYLAGLNNDFLLVWDLVTGELILANDRLGANVVLFGPDRQQVYTLSAAGQLRVYGLARGDLLETVRVFDQYSGVWAYDAVGGWLALGSEEGAVQVWDMPALTAVNVLEGPASPSAALAISPDGATLAAASENGTVTLWNFAEGQVRATSHLMTAIVDAIYAPSGRALVVNSGDGVLVLDASTAQVVFRLTEAPNAGLFDFFAQADTLMLGGVDADMTLWDTAAGRRIAVLPGTRGERPSADTAPAGDMIMTSTRAATSFWNLSGLASDTVLRGNATLPEMDIFRTVWTGDGLQILLFEAIGPVRVMGIP